MAITDVTNNVIETLDASKLTGSLPDALQEVTKSASNPTINTNPAGGLGTVWANTTSGNMFILTDATVGANVWTNMGTGVGNIVPSQFMSATNTNGIETTDGDYKVVTFNTSGSFTPSIGINATIGNKVDYLVVAGGGGGGGFISGGGGAGGYLTATNFTVTNTELTVTIGAGGEIDTAGSNSVFASITSTGGGQGGGYTVNGFSGGSGGGGGGQDGTGSALRTGGAASPSGQGNSGGTTPTGSTHGASGGGGAGSVGISSASVTHGYGANGGNGTANSITGSSVIYAGGAGGGNRTHQVGHGGNGGSGGGGNGGGANHTSSNGGINLGGGGGGHGFGTSNAKAGGSGVVIIRYKFQ